jgi:hypothetical protein
VFVVRFYKNDWLPWSERVPGEPVAFLTKRL